MTPFLRSLLLLCCCSSLLLSGGIELPAGSCLADSSLAGYAALQQAGQLSAAGEYKQALELFLLAGAANGGNCEEAIIYCALQRVQCRIQLGDTAQVQRIIRQIIGEAAQRPPFYYLVSYGYGLLARLAVLERHYAAAIPHYRRALDFAQQAYQRETLTTATLLNDLGIACYREGDYHAAADCYKRALKLRIGMLGASSLPAAKVLNNLGVLERSRSDYVRALAYFQNVLTIKYRHYQRSDPALVTTYLNLGNLYHSLGDYESAIPYFKQALDIRRRELGENDLQLTAIYNGYGLSLMRREEYGPALAVFGKVLEICQNNNSSASLSYAYVLNNLGICHYLKGDINEATTYVEKAFAHLSTFLKVSHPDILKTKSYLAQFLLLQNKPTQAENLLAENLALQRSEGVVKGLQYASDSRRLGDVYFQRRNYRLALFNYQESLKAVSNNFCSPNYADNPVFYDVISGTEAIHALQAKARCLEAYSNKLSGAERQMFLEWALKASIRASDLLRLSTFSYPSEHSKRAFAKQKHYILDCIVRLAYTLHNEYLDPDYLKEAYTTLTLSKQSILLADLRMNSLLENSKLPDSLFYKWKSVRKRMNNGVFYSSSTVFLQDQLASEANLQSLYLRQEYDQILDSIYTRIPQFFEQQFAAREQVVPPVFAALQPGSILLDYFVGEKYLYLFVLKENKLNLLLLDDRATIEALSSDLISSVLRITQRSRFEEHVQAAGSVLLPDSLFSKCNTVRKIIVVADDFLNNLPFELFFYGRNLTPNQATDCPILLKYYYSASFLKSQDKKLLTVKKNRFGGFAPGFIEQESGSLVTRQPVSIAVPEAYQHLKYSQSEVAEVANLFLQSGHLTSTFIAADASEVNFKSHAAEFTWLHLATHSIADIETPSRSIFMLHQPADSTSGEDNLLYAHEIAGLDLRQLELVVLSSCESGYGKVEPGEGTVALSRAFIAAGARNVLASLWKVDDKATHEFMLLFYHNYLSGHSAEEALRLTRLTMQQNPRTSDPYYWAAFVLVGG